MRISVRKGKNEFEIKSSGDPCFFHRSRASSRAENQPPNGALGMLDAARMEFRIAADELKKALHRAQGIVERKSTMPILSNVLVNA